MSNKLCATALALTLAASTAALAQYPGGTTGMPGSTSPSTSKSYGVNKAAVGAAAGAGVGGAILLMTKLRPPERYRMRRPRRQNADERQRAELPASQRPPDARGAARPVHEKSRDTSGTEGFDVLKVRKDLGRCEHEAKSNNATTARR